ncbi:MAG: hypothetical protein NTU53_22500 [Planctomycetota bacterium]|nr:hypothetical protein [Planctomycetota bacterium]
MSDPFSIFLIFMGVIAIGTIVFGVWIVATIVRLLARFFLGLFRWNPMPHNRLAPARRCPRRGCQAVNPSAARFCRRCGHELINGQMACHAAIW